MKLTPGEELVLEVLASRWRLGETLWTFDVSQKRWLYSLESKGLISVLHGIVENTLRARLMPAGFEHYWPQGAPERGQQWTR